MTKPKGFPEVTESLLSALANRFPDETPRTNPGGFFDFGKKAGHQEVIDFLTAQHRKQEKAKLKQE